MEQHNYRFLTDLLESTLLGGTKGLTPHQLNAYWSGSIKLPLGIERDIDAYLSQPEPEALIRAAVWIVRNYAVSSHDPGFHLRVVRWLFEHDRLDRSELLELLALTSTHSLDEAGRLIAWESAHMLGEARLEEGWELVIPMLLAYPIPSIFVDFNNRDPDGHLRLNLTGTVEDLAAQSLVLKAGMFLPVSDGDLAAWITVIEPGPEGIWRGKTAAGPQG